MSSLLTTLGLRSDSNIIPNLAPYHTIFNFLFAYVFLAARPLKMLYKIDHNISPREDLVKYGDKYVQDGKITRSQLNLLKRNEAAHANAMEHFPLFVGSVLFASAGAVSNQRINVGCLAYGVARVIYSAAYLGVGRDVRLSYVRSLSWWASTWACLWLLWESGKGLNAGGL